MSRASSPVPQRPAAPLRVRVGGRGHRGAIAGWQPISGAWDSKLVGDLLGLSIFTSVLGHTSAGLWLCGLNAWALCLEVACTHWPGVGTASPKCSPHVPGQGAFGSQEKGSWSSAGTPQGPQPPLTPDFSLKSPWKRHLWNCPSTSIPAS